MALAILAYIAAQGSIWQHESRRSPFVRKGLQVAQIWIICFASALFDPRVFLAAKAFARVASGTRRQRSTPSTFCSNAATMLRGAQIFHGSVNGGIRQG